MLRSFFYLFVISAVLLLFGCGDGNDDPAVNVTSEATGILDITFDDDGIVTYDSTAGSDQGRAIALDGFGNIIVAGTTENNTIMNIWKYSGTGALDGTFGTGGLVTDDSAAGGAGFDVGNGMAVDGSGNIFVTGYSLNAAGNVDMVIWKYDSSGVLDGTFGVGGVVIDHNAAGGDGQDSGNAIAIDGMGDIYITGKSFGNPTGDDMAIWKYNSSGTLDGTFGIGGIVTYHRVGGDSGNAIALDGAGNIYVSGHSGNASNDLDMAIWKYDSNGVSDATFGTAGVVFDDTSTGNYEVGNSLRLDGSGNIFVTGYSDFTPGGAGDMALWKYDSSGTPDMTFGLGGYVIDNGAAGGNSYDNGIDITLDGSGNLFVVGYSYNASNVADMAIWKYDSNGDLDATFGIGGVVIDDGAAGGTGFDAAYASMLDSLGNLFTTGTSSNVAGNPDMVIWKYE
ncbi:MAG: SBBP repeat-containing protein [Desulfuromusa sp.]|nr:SBBP repeat-containing protein [Desulfuromusa sp.]